MKRLLKFIIALTIFSFATANAALTEAQNAAIKIVTDAVDTGNENDIKTAVNQQIALHPEIAAEIVTAALNRSNVSDANKKIIVRVAAFTAPNEFAAIRDAINRFSNDAINRATKDNLISLAQNSSNTGKAILNAANGRSNSNTNKSLVSFN